VQQAIDFYRQPVKGSRTLSCMMAMFRWIKGENDIKRLRIFEREGNLLF
jgi:hypothetical protein